MADSSSEINDVPSLVVEYVLELSVRKIPVEFSKRHVWMQQFLYSKQCFEFKFNISL